MLDDFKSMFTTTKIINPILYPVASGSASVSSGMKSASVRSIPVSYTDSSSGFPSSLVSFKSHPGRKAARSFLPHPGVELVSFFLKI